MSIEFLNGRKAIALNPANKPWPQCRAAVGAKRCTAKARWAFLLFKETIPVCRTHANVGERHACVLEVVRP